MLRKTIGRCKRRKTSLISDEESTESEAGDTDDSMTGTTECMHSYVYTLNIMKAVALVEHDSDVEESGQSTSTTHNQPQVTSCNWSLTSHAQSASHASISKSSTPQCTLQTFSPKHTKQRRYLVASPCRRSLMRYTVNQQLHVKVHALP